MKKIKLLLLAATAFTATYGQKLPNKQETSVRVPSNVKIDGKATEWDNKFQAYNTATNLYYTIADNTETIYFTAHIKDPEVIKRITNNGFTFEMFKDDSQKSKDMISITLPFAASKYFNLNLPKPTGANPAFEKEVLKSNNAALNQFHKFTVIKGVKGLDSVSVYDDEAGIRFAEAFDINNDYTLELQLPVKFIQTLPGDNSKFFYRLVINGQPDTGPDTGIATFSPTGSIIFTPARDMTDEQRAAADEIRTRIAKKNAPTNFSATYTLQRNR